jgi:hypothetical protein
VRECAQAALPMWRALEVLAHRTSTLGRGGSASNQLIVCGTLTTGMGWKHST